MCNWYTFVVAAVAAAYSTQRVQLQPQYTAHMRYSVLAGTSSPATPWGWPQCLNGTSELGLGVGPACKHRNQAHTSNDK